MPKTDRDIGAIVAALRGQVPQRDLAEQMTDRGFKWTQGTVSSVEKGERSLKLTEGAVLAEVLGTDVQSLVGDEGAAHFERKYRAGEQAFMDARRELRTATRKHLAAQAYLRGIRSSLTDEERDIVDMDLQVDPVVVVAHEKERSEDELQGGSQMVKDIMAAYTAGPRHAGRRIRGEGLEGVSQSRLL